MSGVACIIAGIIADYEDLVIFNWTLQTKSHKTVFTSTPFLPAKPQIALWSANFTQPQNMCYLFKTAWELHSRFSYTAQPYLCLHRRTLTMLVLELHVTQS